MEKPEVIKGKFAAPDKQKWYDFQLREIQDTPKRYEDAAKFLSSMISISLAIFLSVSGKTGFREIGPFAWVITGLILWMVSLVLSFFVLFPFRYRFAADSIETFQRTHQKIVCVKRFLLILSLVFFFIALLILVVLSLC
jgi:hypothetical protein